LSPVNFAIASPIESVDIPLPVNRGEIGVALTNQATVKSYTIIFGKHSGGGIFAVHFNKGSNQGGLLIADGYGNNARRAAIYRDLEITQDFKSLLSSKQDGNAKSKSITQ
jgi:hypothetical protein